jgi:prolyl 4-hydroxylase
MQFEDWSVIPLVNAELTPEAYQINTDKAQFYFVPNFLSPGECEQIIRAINLGLTPSEVTTDESYWRTSRTCHLPEVAPLLASALDIYLSDLTGIHQDYAEAIQGQRYDPGEYFKAHHDWFDPEDENYEEYCKVGGQRTWTAMVYLNDVEEGGETDFPHLGITVTPVTGLVLIWNNLNEDGSPNEFTLHESLPVKKGSKYVITKWYREQPGCLLD